MLSGGCFPCPSPVSDVLMWLGWEVLLFPGKRGDWSSLVGLELAQLEPCESILIKCGVLPFFLTVGSHHQWMHEGYPALGDRSVCLSFP